MANILFLVRNPDLIRRVVDQLKATGHQVVVIKDGEEGLKRLREARELPDIIFTDIKIGKLDGWNFIANVKHTPIWAHLPCIVISGDETEHELVLTRGADGAVVNPPYYQHVNGYVDRLAIKTTPAPVRIMVAPVPLNIQPVHLQSAPVQAPYQQPINLNLPPTTPPYDPATGKPVPYIDPRTGGDNPPDYRKN